MTTKRKAPVRRCDRSEGGARQAIRRTADTPSSRRGRRHRATAPPQGRETPASRSGPLNATTSRSDTRPTPPRGTKQAKARAKARKAKAPKVVRAPLRKRLIIRLGSIDLRPRTLAAKVPFVVLVIGSLGVGLGITLWLSTDAAERSYQLGGIREQNRALLQQKEALERDVLTAESAPALAEAARKLGMIPTRDTAHLVQDPVGNWVVVGRPMPAEGVPPPALNTKLPEDKPPAPPAPPMEVPVRLPPGSRRAMSPAVPGAPHLSGGRPISPGVPNTAPGVPSTPPGVPDTAPPATFRPPAATSPQAADRSGSPAAPSSPATAGGAR